MLTLIDNMDRTYSLIFGPKIKLVKNCRFRKITRISVAKFVGRRLEWINLDMQNPDLETVLGHHLPVAEFHYPQDSVMCYLKFDRQNFITDISILGHDQVYRVNFTFVMEN
jgi:hypothetical protein